MTMSNAYPRLIRNLVDQSLTLLRNTPEGVDLWRSQILPEWVNATVPQIVPTEFIAWIRNDKEYGFIYDDAVGKVCGKPQEVVAYLLIELVKELVEEALEQ
jgi:hypothetical protein